MLPLVLVWLVVVSSSRNFFGVVLCSKEVVVVVDGCCSVCVCVLSGVGVSDDDMDRRITS